MERGSIVYNGSHSLHRGHDDEILDIAFDSTGQHLATASADGEFSSLLPSPLTSLPSPLSHHLPLPPIKIPPSPPSPAGPAQVFNTTTHNCLSRLQGHKGEISKVSSPCHPLILAPRPLIPRPPSPTLTWGGIDLFPPFLIQVTFNPQGSRVLTASSDKTAKLWDHMSGRCLQVRGV